MLRFTCPSCEKKLAAKEEMVGRIGKCPNCGQPIRVAVEAAEATSIPLDEADPNAQVLPASEEHLPFFHRPERLDRDSHYLICDKTNLVATWENNGNGWMLKTTSGLISAKRNRDKLPNEGEFQLVELKFSLTPEGKRLTGITCYKLASRWALNVLDQGDDAILERIVGPGSLNREQKFAIRQVLKSHFMRPVWENATAVLEYLS